MRVMYWTHIQRRESHLDVGRNSCISPLLFLEVVSHGVKIVVYMKGVLLYSLVARNV